MEFTYWGKKVVVVGLGATGISCLDFFLKHGVVPKAMDTRIQPPGLGEVPSTVLVHCGSLRVEWLLEADLVVVSPGVSLETDELQCARAAGVEIVGDIELFGRAVKAPVAAVTGSNGKSTVTTMLGEMVREAGIAVAVGGNIGVPVLQLFSQPADLYVLELSSFQLESTQTLPLAVATILNVTLDHQDRYPEGLGSYRSAKQRIYRQAENCISNAEDPLTLPPIGACGKGITFGLSNGNYRLVNYNGGEWLAAYGEPLLAVAELPLIGRHNWANALAAIAMADALSIPRAAVLHTLRKFTGLAHRLQTVWHGGGISWINDSKATNVASTASALSGFTWGGRLHLLLGGEGKSADFTPLAPYLQGDSIYVYCFGKAAPQLMELRPEISQSTTTLAQAMRLIASRAMPGDTVLLSPACASFDQFSNFEQRGMQFATLAQEVVP